MNKSADYCDDFYNYVCGGYDNSTSLPEASLFRSLKNKVIKELNTIIEKYDSPDKPEVFMLAKKLYNSCMDTDTSDEQKKKHLLDYLEQLGGWPVLKPDNEWNETLFNWDKNIVEIFNNTYWFTDFFAFELTINNNQNNLNLKDYSSMSKQSSNTEYHSYDSEYIQKIINRTVEWGATRERATNELSDVFIFEIKLKNLTKQKKNYQNQDSASNKMTLGYLASKYPYFEWKNYLNFQLSYSNISVNDEEIIYVDNPEYFDQLGKLMNSTPKRTQANYKIWKKIENVDALTEGKIPKPYKNHLKAINENIQDENRWINCTKTVSKVFSIATNSLYVRKYFDKDLKYNVAIIVENIHNQFLKLINNNNWMDKKTKTNVKNKAEKMRFLVGYLDELLNNSMINNHYKFYKHFKMIDDSYVKSFISLNLFNEHKVKWSRFKQNDTYKLNIDILFESSLVNAFNNRFLNLIMIPAAIIQSEFFNNTLPKYMNYGALGSIIGHEIMHAFDNIGKYYDADGNWLTDWLSNSSNEKYQEKIQCIIDQYGNYTVKQINMNVNGYNTRSENIADNGGIKAVYLAYNDWANDNNKLEKQLPGFNFTPQQMFWISYAHTWCFKKSLKSQIDSITNNVHSPSEFRINGPLSNLEEFSKDFKCPIGSKMNPKKKCTIW